MNPEPLVTFGNPAMLWALGLLPLAAALFFWSEKWRARALSRLVAARLQDDLAGSVSHFKRRLHFALALAALACFITALAQPRHGFTLEESHRKGRDVLIAVDTSRSMLATDVKPDRLERAKFAAQDLIGALQGDRAGLLAFAGSTFLQAPLTVDYTAVLDSLRELDTNIIPLGGTDIAAAIRAARQAFGSSEGESRVLVIFTDGEDLSQNAIEAAKAAAGTMTIFTVGVGSANGSLIPITNENGGTEFVKGPDGQFVKSRLDERTLTAIAAATGGFYTRLQNSPVEMKRLVEAGLGKLKEGEIDARLARRPIERYQWPLGLGVALLIAATLLGERRNRKPASRAGAMAALALFAGLSISPARADEGVDLYKQGKFAEAKQQFEATSKRRPGLPDLEFNKGAADYALGHLDDAFDAFGRALSTRDPKLRGRVEYNLGTTLLKRALGRDETKQAKEREADLKNAIQHLEEALKADAQNHDVQTNLDIAKRELAKPKPTPPPQKQKQDDKKDSKDQQSKDQQSKDQQSKNQQSKDQQSKDQQSKNQQAKDQQAKDQQSKDQQSKDQQSKDQQAKNQQSKDQQSKDQQSKNQQSKDQQSKDQQSKDQQSKNQQAKDQQAKDQQAKDQQAKDQQSKDQQAKDQQGQKPQPQPGETPAPTPGDEKKLSGDIKANDASAPNKQDEAAEAPVKPGEMSPAQARAVLDSLKGEDEQPFKIQQRSAAPVLKNW